MWDLGRAVQGAQGGLQLIERGLQPQPLVGRDPWCRQQDHDLCRIPFTEVQHGNTGGARPSLVADHPHTVEAGFPGVGRSGGIGNRAGEPGGLRDALPGRDQRDPGPLTRLVRCMSSARGPASVPGMSSEATSRPVSAVPVAAFDLALPRKRMASTVLLFDESDRVLVVEPIYVDFMELPGGAVELDESPRQAAVREVKEELGLDRDPGRLLAMDWVPPRSGRSEGLITVFDGGRCRGTGNKRGLSLIL